MAVTIENYLFQSYTSLILYYFLSQYINKTGVRVCLKELYGTKYDPLFISYTVLSGKDENNALLYVHFAGKIIK